MKRLVLLLRIGSPLYDQQGREWGEGVDRMLEQFAWPGVALVLGFASLFIFRSPLTRLIDRISKVGPTGVTAIPTIQESGKSVEPPQGEQLREVDNAVLLKYETRVRVELDTRRFPTLVDREKYLIRSYTAIVLCLAFEKMYLHIYGSQLAALQFLNTQGTSGAEVGDVYNVYFLPAKVLYPQLYDTYSFEQWMQYLTSQEMISRNGTRITATAEAKEFLKYLVERGYAFTKPF